MIDVAIVSYGSKDMIEKNLEFFRFSKMINSVYILENSKSHASDWETFAMKSLNIHVIISDENLGYGAGVRKLIEQTTSSHCLVLNPDCRPIGGALELLLSHQIDCDCVIVSGTLMNDLAELDSRSPYVNLLTSQPTQVAAEKKVGSSFRFKIFPGAFFLVDIERFRNTYGYSKMFLYFDEMDTVCQLGRSNHIFHVLDNQVGIHSRASTTGDSFNNKASFTAYWSTRNAMVVWKTFFPWYLPTVLISRLINALRYFCIGNFHASYATLRGICTGLCSAFNR